MRFLHVNHRYWPYHGGSERYIQAVAEHYAGAGNFSTVVTTTAYDLEFFWNQKMTAVRAPAVETINGVQVYRVPVKHLPASPIAFQGSRRLMGESSRFLKAGLPFRRLSRVQPWLPGLSAQLEQLSPCDVIHGSNLGLEGPAITASEIARKWDARFVLTPFIHLGSGYSENVKRYVSMPHQLALLQSSELILTMTEMERSFIAGLGIDRDKIKTVGAGINIEEVAGGDARAFRRKHQIGGYLVASIGALAPDKGTTSLVRAVQRLRKDGVDVSLVLVGPALSSFKRWYGKLDRSERDGILVTGVISTEEKRDLLAAMDVLVLASRTESFGIVYLEAWANEKPVVAASVGAVTELVHHDQNGLLVEFDDDLDIATRIQQLIDNPKFASRLGNNGFNMTMAHFTWKAVLDRVTAAYENMLGHPVC